MSASFAEQPSDWTRAEWLQWRRQGVGGSDCAAICGMSQYGSPMSVYLDKLALAPEQPDNENMEWGRRLEPIIGDVFTEHTGLLAACPQLLAWDDAKQWRRATLDGLVVESPNSFPTDALGTIQKKTTGDSSWRDGVPDAIALQCQYELGVAEMERCWLAVLHFGFGRHFEVYEIEADHATYGALCRIVDRFWLEHVLAENPPPADSNPATTAALKDAFADRADGSSVLLDEGALYYAQEWLPAKAAVKEAEQHLELIENRLRAALGDAVEGCDEVGPLLSWKPQRLAGRIDDKRLAADHPEIAAEYRKPDSTVRVLRATKALKDRAQTAAAFA